MRNSDAKWMDARQVKDALISDGWHSPDTYGKEFMSVGHFPSVYLFILHDQDTYKRGLIAYVGQSIDLRQRLSGHPILKEIDAPGYWAMRWFKPTPAEVLTSVELHYIQDFDPPWNIQGRRRGVALQ